MSLMYVHIHIISIHMYITLPCQALSIKMGEVPDWLAQRYKSKWMHKKPTEEEKAAKHEEQKQEKEQKKIEQLANAKKELEEAVQQCPASSADMQTKRNWDLDVTEKLMALLTSPRAKKRVKQYVQARRKTSATEAGKQATASTYVFNN